MNRIRIYILDPCTKTGPEHPPHPSALYPRRCARVEHYKHYRYDASPRWAREHDNGALISCGLSTDEASGIGTRYLSKVPPGAVEVTREEWQHSGCQSSCVRRGAKECRW